VHGCRLLTPLVGVEVAPGVNVNQVALSNILLRVLEQVLRLQVQVSGLSIQLVVMLRFSRQNIVVTLRRD